MGLGTRGLTFRGLSFNQRVLMVGVVRQAALLNVWGQQLCLPFGGGGGSGSARGLAGVRAGHVQGLVGGNVRAMLTHGSWLCAFDERYPALAPFLSMDTTNTNDLELGFSLIWSACNGCKPEFFQTERSSRRIEALEMIRSNDDIKFEARRRGKQAGKYSASVQQREAARVADSGGQNIDPNCAGSIAELEAVQKTAVENASAADETIRGIHSKKGIGKVGA